MIRVDLLSTLGGHNSDICLSLKVAALAHVSKSNPYNFWRRGRVMDLNYVSEVLCRSLLACASYGRKEKVKIATNSKCYLIN